LRAAIFANGTLPYPDLDRAKLSEDDWIIAADGGAKHCLTLGITPDVLIGDFDSLNPQERHTFEQAGAKTIPHPSQKNETDLEIAMHYAIDAGAEEIIIFGGMGERWDQSLANLLLPTLTVMKKAQVWLTSGPQSATVLKPGETHTLRGRPGDTISLIPLAGDALGVCTEGLEYPLHNETLIFGSTRGVSNVFLREDPTIHLHGGMLACIVIHNPEEYRR
jgi:thiamine pyrophosphokinase